MTDMTSALKEIEIPRAGLAARIFGFLRGNREAGARTPLVHAFGPHGFGKFDLATELASLAQADGRPVVELDLSQSENQTLNHLSEPRLIDEAARSLAAGSVPPRGADVTAGTLAEDLIRRLTEMCREQPSRPLLLLTHAEGLLGVPDVARPPLHCLAEKVSQGETTFDLVTFANFPIELLTGEDVVPESWRQIALRSISLSSSSSDPQKVFGAGSAGADPQDIEMHKDMADWVLRKCRRAPGNPYLERMTPALAEQLCDLVVQKTSGHPALTMLLLDRTLNGMGDGYEPNGFLNSESALLGESKATVRSALFPEIENTVKYPCGLAEKISRSLDELRAFKLGQRKLLNAVGDTARLRLWAGLGVIVDRG